MKNEKQGKFALFFDESNLDVDITILKYFLQVLMPNLFWVGLAYIS
jgi:hypothetical protein